MGAFAVAAAVLAPLAAVLWLAFDPAERTPSAKAFAADLRAFLAGEEVPSHRYGLTERTARSAARNVGLLFGSTLVALLVGLAGAASVVATEAEQRSLRG